MRFQNNKSMILVGVRTVDSGLVCGCSPGGRALAPAPAMAPPQFIVTTVKTKQNPQPAPAQLPLPSSQPNLDFYVLESGAPPYFNTAMLTSPTTTNPTTTTAFEIAAKKSTEISEEKYFWNCFPAAGNCFWVSSCNFVPAVRSNYAGIQYRQR